MLQKYPWHTQTAHISSINLSEPRMKPASPLSRRCPFCPLVHFPALFEISTLPPVDLLSTLFSFYTPLCHTVSVLNGFASLPSYLDIHTAVGMSNPSLFLIKEHLFLWIHLHSLAMDLWVLVSSPSLQVLWSWIQYTGKAIIPFVCTWTCADIFLLPLHLQYSLTTIYPAFPLC